MSNLSTHIPESALYLLKLLANCPCDICKKEIKRIEEQYNVVEKYKVNKAEMMDDIEEVEWHCRYYECGNVINEDEEYCKSCRDRLNPKDHFVDVNKMVCDSRIPENK